MFGILQNSVINSGPDRRSRCRLQIQVQRVKFRIENQSRREVIKTIEEEGGSMPWGELRWLCVGAVWFGIV
jgi:hypothetical protein